MTDPVASGVSSATQAEAAEGPSALTTAQLVPEDEAADSTYGDEESYTTSLKSSITAYEYEHGRRFHAYRAGSYNLPNDEEEQDRLDMQYHTLRLAFDDKPFLAPIEKSPQAILDIGTGTGIWAIEVADLYPSAVVTGTDLSPIQPKWVPPNARFEIDDVEQPWTYPKNHFDLIHTRIMNGGIRNWPALFEQSFKHCKPGGWVECQELDVDARTDDNSFPENSYIRKWSENQVLAAEKAGVSLRISGDVLRDQMKEAGFENIVVREYKVPIGIWPKDPKMREIGTAQLIAMLEGIHGLTIAFWTRFLNWSPEEIEVFLDKTRAEFSSRNIHSYWPVYVVYGQKPNVVKNKENTS